MDQKDQKSVFTWETRHCLAHSFRLSGSIGSLLLSLPLNFSELSPLPSSPPLPCLLLSLLLPGFLSSLPPASLPTGFNKVPPTYREDDHLRMGVPAQLTPQLSVPSEKHPFSSPHFLPGNRPSGRGYWQEALFGRERCFAIRTSGFLLQI